MLERKAAWLVLEVPKYLQSVHIWREDAEVVSYEESVCHNTVTLNL